MQPKRLSEARKLWCPMTGGGATAQKCVEKECSWWVECPPVGTGEVRKMQKETAGGRIVTKTEEVLEDTGYCGAVHV